MDSIGIPEFYAGRSIFITGATGFMGKVLVEKLLRSCPDLNNIYVLVRSKRGKSPKERWEALTEVPLFDLLKEQRPDALSKQVKVLDGDVRQANLGLNNDDYQLLEQEVSVIFHVAATVRFNEPFDEAVKMNTCSTKQVIDLAMNMKKLKALVHVSTAYSNSQISEVEEKIYPTIADWREVVNVAEKIDPLVLQILTTKYMNGLPNTYVFSKSLAEALIWEVRDKLPIVIFRPSIVICSWKEPMPGWVDNFNGPVGLIIGVGKGLIRTMPANPDTMADFMPVDVAIKALIVCAWKKATFPLCNHEDFIYNCATTYKSITNGEIVKIGLAEHEKNPMEEIMWHQSVVQQSVLKHRVEAIYKHLIPAVFIDLVMRLFKKEPMFLKIQTKIHVSMLALSYFLLREWKFHNNNFIKLIKDIPAKDKTSFEYDFFDLIPREFFEIAGIAGGKKYLLKESGQNPEKSKRNFRILKYIHYTLLTIFQAGLAVGLYKIYCSYEAQ